MKAFAHEFVVFGLKQARACIFAGAFFVLLFASFHISIPGLYRYDVLFLAALVLQAVLVASGIETRDELKVICLFHVVGLALEIFKTHPSIGSWAYPEQGIFKIAGVPLYSGFMYAAVASYMIQSWRIFKLQLVNYPSYRLALPLALGIYANFFTHHFIPDVRWFLAVAVLVVFRRTRVEFKVVGARRWMPVALSFFLIAFFVWVAENISTFFGAWQYPHQEQGWSLVSFHKVGSWSLLVIISFIIVAHLRHVKETRKPAGFSKG